MGFSSTNGYVPKTVEEIIDLLMAELNTQFDYTYTTETFIGTEWYKFFYAGAQMMQLNEVKASEVFQKLQDYIATTNEAINRPAVTPQGLIDRLEDEGYVASVKPPADADAGKLYVCVDTDETDPDYAATKLEINTIIKDSSVAGVVSQGTESSSIALSNGQSFDFKFNLPDRIEPLIRLTTTLSENNQVVVLSPEAQKQILLDNIAELYRLGKNFEPQRYFSLDDAPWASDVLLEYKIGGGSWESAVYVADYDELFEILLENIELVEN